MKKNKAFLIVILVIAIFTCCGCSKAKEKVDEKLSIAAIKSIPICYDENLNEVTFGEMTKKIFFKPKWDGYEGNLYSFDEDGDGEPDEKIDYYNAVEFSGKFKYEGEKYELTIVFSGDVDDSAYLSMISATLNGEYISSELTGNVLDTLWMEHIGEEE